MNRRMFTRLIFAIGIGLFLGGWAGMRYADEQQQATPTGETDGYRPHRRFSMWARGGSYDLAASRDIMAVSGLLFATGGLLAALSGPGVIVGVLRATKLPEVEP